MDFTENNLKNKMYSFYLDQESSTIAYLKTHTPANKSCENEHRQGVEKVKNRMTL